MMNPTNQSPQESREDDHFAAVLAAVNTDAAPLDPDALARLREQSTAAFGAASHASEMKRPTFTRFERWLGAIAALVLVCIGFYFWFASNASAATLGQALDNAEKATTLQARLTVGKKQIESWHTTKPARSRWDDLDGNYRIADGKHLWIVNENINEARRAKADADAIRRPVHQLLNMLGLPKERANVLAALPVKQVRDGQNLVLVYRTEIDAPEGRIGLEALVIAKSHRIHSIRTWLDKAGKIEPLGELTVIAYDRPIPDEKFAIAATLTEDGRIGKVTDVQGIVSVKPVLHDRWTPVHEHLVLRPGDWVRTDARGANATALRLVQKSGVILGPKTLVELIGPKQLRLIEGELEITPAAGTAIELQGPGPQKIAVKDRQFFRVQKQLIARVEKDPPWLLGFKGVTTNETLGSLVALVDGRSVSLSVGYHKVQVDIRDQIARTVVEESFVNHTNSELEGVFYFPLPPDASISGFGMWIGDNLVEADVVEKQRAREIYETILRERRDPGLLEWSGGNIFKARVFPIPARSEKRIKITYTQVLPLKGSRYRYSYALQSELLQQHPLRDLSIDVKVNSVAALKSVTSPTHSTRDELTTHSAHVEFSAQEYTPPRDFEVVVEVEGRQNDVVVIPHRRGDDGYFLLQLTPPGAAGDWNRPILPNGEPVNLLIVADTSASIDAGQRATQATFIASLLGSLTPKDSFNLAACDVTTDWAFGQAVAAGDRNVAAAREFLAQRTSLGWTNLDAAFAAALKQMAAIKGATHVVYVGDGIVTTGDADPVAFTKRLRRLVMTNLPRVKEFQIDPVADIPHFAGVSSANSFHAVTLGSSYETGVMKAIATIGGGSVRKITGEQGPAAVARELLGEIAQPALRDIKVEFKGLQVARVYPDSLANVPAGSQQILLGRYLPEGKDQSGEVIITGTQGGKPVRFNTRLSLKDAEQGNSFIPRLWARMHLDGLLEQGAAPAIKDEIIALSEEYQIITPYTSFLVLETDADRERFKVKRRFQMRDGERFFADGRDNAVFDLAQKQMQKAGNWRTALRRSILSDFAKLGREPRIFGGSPIDRLYKSRLAEKGLLRLGDFTEGWDYDGPMGGADYAGRSELGFVPWGAKEEESLEVFKDTDEARIHQESAADRTLADKREPAEPQTQAMAGEPWFHIEDEFGKLSVDGKFLAAAELPLYDMDGFGGELLGRESSGRFARGTVPYYRNWLNTLFPSLHSAPEKTKEPKSPWPAAARDLARSLLRTEQLAKMTGGIAIDRQTDAFDVRWDELAARAHRLELASAKSWVTRTWSDSDQTIVSWGGPKEIGIYSKAFQLGRVRAVTPLDIQPPPLQLNDYSMSSLEHAFQGYAPTIEPQGKDRTLLVLKHTTTPNYESRILIDTSRHVILSMEDRHKGKMVTTIRFDDFVEAAGTWWAQRVETLNKEMKRTSLVTQTVKTLSQKEFDQQTKTELAGRAQVQFLHLPMPSVAVAKKAVATGKADFDDHFILLLHFHQTQQWPRVLEHLQEAEKRAANRPGMRWVRSAILGDSRRHDEVRQRLEEDAKRLVKSEPADAYFLVGYVVGQASSVFQANEMLTLLDFVKPLYEKQPKHVHALQRWQQLRVNNLSHAGRSDEALALQKQMATGYPRDYSLQQRYASALAAQGDYPAAYAWLDRVIVKEAKWLEGEEESLRDTYAGLLRGQGRYADLVKYLDGWIARNPARSSSYEQNLSALVRVDQIEKADALALRWLKDAQVAGELRPDTQARLYAATQFLLGQGYQLWTNRIEDRWLAPLGEAALFFARHETQVSTTEQILSSHGFQRTEEAARVRKKLAGILTDEVAKLPAEHVRRLVDWLRADDADPADWKKITAALRERWTKETKDADKDALGRALISALNHQNLSNEVVAFLRLQWQNAPKDYRIQYANRLFERLLSEPWTAAFESEALAMLALLSDADDAGARILSSVAALHRATDRLLDNRIAAGAKALTHAEKLTRTELFKKQEDNRRQAREGLADRLRKEANNASKTLAPWLVAESVYLDVALDRNLKQASAEAWEALGNAPPKIDKDADPANTERLLAMVLRQRYQSVLMNLAARKNADAALVERLLKYIDQGIAQETDANRWKAAKYRLLVALDRTKELEQTLTPWTRQDDPDNRWRVALGYLLAEQGRLPDAIREFEAVEAADELTPAMYRSLSDWYLVQQKREASERAALAVYKTTPEHILHRTISNKLRPWHHREGRVPTELDKEVLRMIAVLFDKSATPQSYLYQLQQFYQASHDFRLLSGLPDAVIGHTAARVYPFVQGMQSVLQEVRDEATADEIVKRIAEIRPGAKTAVDLRALDMLETLVERRAAEVQNQPGPHRDKALAALVRASKREWGPGEPRLMADFLAGLGKISQQPLAEEQLRQLKALHADAIPGTIDRLHIAHNHAITLHGYNRVADAIDLLEVALDEFKVKHDGFLPVTGESALEAYVGYLQSAGHYARGEKALLGQLARPVHAQQRRWLIERVNRLYLHALERDGDVSIGKGAVLYRALERKIQTDLADADQQHRYQLVHLLCQVYRAAASKKLPDVAADVRSFAFKALPPILKEQTTYHESIVSEVASTLRDLAGPRDGIVFLLNQIENEPRWLRWTNQDGWSRHAHTLGDWRREAKDLGDVEGRLLKLVLAELRRDLETGYARNRAMYYQRSDGTRYWKEKEADFVKTADAVLAERNKSGASVQYIAEYFYYGVDRPKRAIEILLIAHNQKLLNEEGQALLVNFLHAQGRYGESIAILQPLVERRPENLEYRVQLMHAFFRTDRRVELLALLKATDAFFHEKDRWGEHPLDRLAHSTLQNELFEQSVAYYKELIPLHERTHHNRGIGNGVLSRYNMGLADAYAGLKKTPEAVDAAAAAIVAWGPNRDKRDKALDKLRDVLRRAPDLDAYVARLDKDKQDSAIIRKALGQVYHDTKQYAKAIRQLEMAALVQPNDAEIYSMLVSAHDELGDKDGAIRQLLQGVQLSRRELKLYEDLGKRYAAAGKAKEAERAYTSIVEMQPSEAESHAILAEIREKEKRWTDAIAHWEQVANLRVLEPTGLLKLTAAQIHEKQWDKARESLRKLQMRSWPPRFSDVENQIRKLEEKLARKE